MPDVATGRAVSRALPVLALLLLPCLAGAQSIYKWVDERGVTHFSENPPPDGKAATKVEVKPTTGPEKPRDENWKERELQFRKRNIEQSAAQKAEDERNARAGQQREARCRAAQRSLDTLKNSHRIYHLDEKGERVYMEDSQRTAEIDKWTREAQDNCR
jgi:hypothetical protein